MCAAVSGTVKDYIAWGRVSGEEIVRRLPDALAACDTLNFTEIGEALAYLVLHLTDRYGRVTEVLERLLQQGYLPVRRTRTAVLDVGAGPAPGVYATVDLYDDFADWIASTERKVALARVTNPDVLDAGSAWDHVLHGFSERLLVERRGQPGERTALLPFRRTYSRQVQGFSVHDEHHAWRAWVQRQILYDFDMADESISQQTAWQMAYQEPAAVPSAYDLIILCNFLTNTHMTEQLGDDLFRLAKSLTPGGGTPRPWWHRRLLPGDLHCYLRDRRVRRSHPRFRLARADHRECGPRTTCAHRRAGPWRYCLSGSRVTLQHLDHNPPAPAGGCGRSHQTVQAPALSGPRLPAQVSAAG
jgi:hypothetical protein